jgi:hypothetical protein
LAEVQIDRRQCRSRSSTRLSARANWKLRNTWRAPCITYTSSPGTRSFGHERFGAYRMASGWLSMTRNIMGIIRPSVGARAQLRSWWPWISVLPDPMGLLYEKSTPALVIFSAVSNCWHFPSWPSRLGRNEHSRRTSRSKNVSTVCAFSLPASAACAPPQLPRESTTFESKTRRSPVRSSREPQPEGQ